MILEQGRPADTAGRLKKEIAVYDLLDKLAIPFDRVDHEAAFTMEACLEIDRILSPAVICKNLLLTNSAKTDFYLLMIREDKKFVTKDISRQIVSTRLSFASPEAMIEYLDITPGAVSVMGLMNDTGHHVKLLVDRDVLQAEWLGCHPCVNTSSLRLRTADVFERFVPATGHGYLEVTAE